jgi:hypothetical protein
MPNLTLLGVIAAALRRITPGNRHARYPHRSYVPCTRTSCALLPPTTAHTLAATTPEIP